MRASIEANRSTVPDIVVTVQQPKCCRPLIGWLPADSAHPRVALLPHKRSRSWPSFGSSAAVSGTRGAMATCAVKTIHIFSHSVVAAIWIHDSCFGPYWRVTAQSKPYGWYALSSTQWLTYLGQALDMEYLCPGCTANISGEG